MKFKLIRRFLGPDYTIGSLLVSGKYLCDMLEDPVRDHNQDGDLDDPGEGKQPGRTAIPYGTYEVDLTWSPKYKKLMPLVMNVPHFEGIRIHRGNTPKDTEGCLLPGENKEKGKVINSTQWEREITELIYAARVRGEKVKLQIVGT